MRGLPPLPPDVVLIEAVWSIGDVQEATTAWHIFSPGADVATDLQLNNLLGEFVTQNCVADLLAIMGTDVSCNVLRLSRYGASPLVVQFNPSFSTGTLGTTNPMNTALVLTWRTAERGSSSLGHTYLPLSDTLVDVDHCRIKALSWSEAQAQARLFVEHVGSMVSPDGGLCVLMVVHRSRGGAPLPNSIMAPVVHGDASPFVGTMRRRIRARRPFSSPL